MHPNDLADPRDTRSRRLHVYIDRDAEQTFSLLRERGHHRVLYMPDIVFEHLNYVPGHKDQRLYQLNPEILRRDAQRFNASSPAREALADNLARHIDSARERRISAMENTVKLMLGKDA